MTVTERFGTEARQLLANARHDGPVGPESVYQEAVPENRRIVDSVVDALMLPGSRIEGLEHLEAAAAHAASGGSVLLLMEHYSNFDIPALFYLLDRSGPSGVDAASRIIAVAGLKLNEESQFVRGFTEAFTRLVIYPSRSLSRVPDGPAKDQELRRSKAINLAAVHHMVRLKHTGHLILVFPSGTRYRPGDPTTRRGVKEVDSYIKQYDYIVPIAISGNILPIDPEHPANMERDICTEDVMVFTCGTMTAAREWRNRVRERASADEDPKQLVADAVMDWLAELHAHGDRVRQSILTSR